MTSTSLFHPFLSVVFIAALAFLYQWIFTNNPPLGDSNSNLISNWTPDTTAILLNWSRFPNVVRLVDTLCDESLNSVVATIVVWNNSPNRLQIGNFSDSHCVKEKLRIHNSPANLYFQARFLACAESSTPLCFIQDDDYLVLPEVISALHAHVSQKGTGVYLLPPHEHLLSELRKVRAPNGIHTSFAWLGHGALIPRTEVVQFLDLMQILNATEEETRMADNYYTILGNTFVETWFDQGIELGGGQAFTVGTAGEERNRRHILRALEMLESAVAFEAGPLPYISTKVGLEAATGRAACASAVCLMETNIRLLPSDMKFDALSATEMLSIETENTEKMVDVFKANYLQHPPSHAVDGRLESAFRSFYTAKVNDSLTLDVFNDLGADEAELVFLIDHDTEPILGNALFEIKRGDTWNAVKEHLVCADAGSFSHGEGLRECGVKMVRSGAENSGVHAFRARLSTDLPFKWCIYEMWLRI